MSVYERGEYEDYPSSPVFRLLRMYTESRMYFDVIDYSLTVQATLMQDEYSLDPLPGVVVFGDDQAADFQLSVPINSGNVREIRDTTGAPWRVEVDHEDMKTHVRVELDRDDSRRLYGQVYAQVGAVARLVDVSLQRAGGQA